MCRKSSQILLNHHEAQQGALDRRFVLGVKLFNSLPLNLFTNDLVRGNTYQLPVSANKPPAHLVSNSFALQALNTVTLGGGEK